MSKSGNHQMADDTNRIIIEVDADTSKFTVKMGDISTTLNNTKTKGESAFNTISMAIIGFNQGLELAQKIIEGVKSALDTIEKSESFDNQRIALDALGKSVGLSGQQISILIDLIKKSSNDTLTTAQATRAAFDLLHAGVKSQNIPTMIEFAQRINAIHPELGGLEAIIQRFSLAVDTANTRSLRPFLEGIKDVGDRQGVINAILGESQKFLAQTGEGYTDYGKKIKTGFDVVSESVTSFLGRFIKDKALAIWGSQVEKTEDQIHKLKLAMDQVQTPESRVAIQQKIAELQGQITKETAQETVETKKSIEAIKQKRDVEKVLDPTTQAKLRVDANVKMYEDLRANDDEYVKHSEEIDKGYFNAKKQKIDAEYNDELKKLNSSLVGRTEYTRRYLELEKHKTEETIKLTKMVEDQQKLTARNVEAGWHSAMLQMQNEWGSWAKTTQKMAVQAHSVMASSITKMAKEHKFAMDEMLNNFLAMIGETLIQKGSADILMSIFPPNPAGLGAGLAEIALGSALVGVSGGGAGASPSTAGSIGSDIGNQQNLTAPAGSQMQQKSAQIVINGDLLNSQETVNHIQELIRKNSDVTDYAIVAQGKQF